MGLSAGARLGPYEILTVIGAGGMGEVYRARDTRLDRVVAIKILREHIATDPDRRARFEREARVISQLNHPHICTLFDVGQEQGTDFLVMEYLDGQTLAARVEKGALSIDQAHQIAIQIADGLDAAHRQGIVHRDLKPANVMLTKTGAKLLDFGIARMLGPAVAGPSEAGHAVPGATMAPTRPPTLTVEGTLLGTLRYMAPEQLEGREADARSDIFAFGCLLFEMLTGRRAFDGESQASVIAAVLEREPTSISTLQRLVPPALDRIVRKCLAKDPDVRWQTARDLVDELRWIAGTGTSTAATVAAPSPRRAPTSKAIVAFAVVVVALAAATAATIAWFGPFGSTRAGGQPVRLSLEPPPGMAFGVSPASPRLAVNAEATSFALSPDGSRVAFVATGPSGQTGVWLRPLATLDAKLIPGTEEARTVFWSPDGGSIGMTAGGKLKLLHLAGGPAVPVCEVPEVGGTPATWGDGAILLAPRNRRILRVSTVSGPPTTEVEPDASRGEISVGWPWFLPDGRRFLYFARLPDGKGRVMLADPGKPPVMVLPASSNAQWVDPDHVVFSRDGTLLTQRFDLVGGRVVGDPVAIADPVQFTRGTGLAAFSVSRTGALVYQSHSDFAELVWFDRSGQELGSVGPQGDYLTMRISPEGRRVLYARQDPRLSMFQLWTSDIDHPVENRLTTEPRSEMGAVWMPGGRGAIYSAETKKSLNLFFKDLTTGAEKQLMPPADVLRGAQEVTRDGKLLVFFQTKEKGADLWLMPADASSAPVLLVPNAGDPARISPDGRLISFRSGEAGRSEIFVQPLSASATKTRVSTEGADMAGWSPDGRELLYHTTDGHIVAVPVHSSGSNEIALGSRVTLFATRGKWPWRDFDIAPDGKRFLAVVPRLMSAEQSLTVVLNWIQEAAR